MSEVLIDRAIELGIKAGIKEALSRIEKAKQEKIKSRHDRRLRNTKLLLRNYNNFKMHCKNAIYTSKQVEEMHIEDILDECDDIDDEGLYVNSIKRTHDRTYIIVKHINRMLQFYRYSAERDNDENAIRRFKAIEMFYISNKKMTYEEIAEAFFVSEKTISRDIKKAIEELSVLIFGADGIKLEV